MRSAQREETVLSNFVTNSFSTEPSTFYLFHFRSLSHILSALCVYVKGIKNAGFCVKSIRMSLMRKPGFSKYNSIQNEQREREKKHFQKHL